MRMRSIVYAAAFTVYAAAIIVWAPLPVWTDPAAAQGVTPVPASKEQTEISVLKQQRNSAMDGVAACYSEAQAAVSALQARIAELEKAAGPAARPPAPAEPKP